MDMKEEETGDELLTPGEVAKMFRVAPYTVARWADAGLLEVLRTPGGHRRYPMSSVRSLQARLTEPKRS